MKTPGAVKRILSVSEEFGQTIDHVRAKLRAGLSHCASRMNFDRPHLELSAHSAARTGVEIPPDAAWVNGNIRPQPDGHPVTRFLGTFFRGRRFGTHGQNLTNIINDSLREEKASRKIQIGARRAHGYG